jgi:hypothetical protein
MLNALSIMFYAIDGQNITGKAVSSPGSQFRSLDETFSLPARSPASSLLLQRMSNPSEFKPPQRMVVFQPWFGNPQQLSLRLASAHEKMAMMAMIAMMQMRVMLSSIMHTSNTP